MFPMFRSPQLVHPRLLQNLLINFHNVWKTGSLKLSRGRSLETGESRNLLIQTISSSNPPIGLVISVILYTPGSTRFWRKHQSYPRISSKITKVKNPVLFSHSSFTCRWTNSTTCQCRGCVRLLHCRCSPSRNLPSCSHRNTFHDPWNAMVGACQPSHRLAKESSHPTPL